MPDQPRDDIEVRHVDGVTVLHFKAGTFLDDRVGRELLRIGGDRGRMAIDFANVTGLTSAFLGCLIRFQQRVTTAGGSLRLQNFRQEIVDTFTTTGLFGDEPGSDGEGMGGVTARDRPPKLPGGGAASLPPPS